MALLRDVLNPAEKQPSSKAPQNGPDLHDHDLMNAKEKSHQRPYPKILGIFCVSHAEGAFREIKPTTTPTYHLT
jgi:hypothetical protein